MENSPIAASSLEKQIDSFLENFRRSASKAMEAEWCSIGGGIGSGCSINSNSNNPALNITGNSATTNTNTMAANTSTTITCENIFSQSVLQTTKQMSFEKQQHLLQRTRSRSSCLDLNNMKMAITSAELDSQLFTALCEIDKYNYLYLFDRCKHCNVNARQLRYFEKDHIRELIPKTQLGILAEFEHLLNEWKVAKGFTTTAIKNEFKRSIDGGNINNRPNFVIEKPQMISKYSQTDNVVKQSIGINTVHMKCQGQYNSPAMVLNEDDELLTVLSYDEETMNLNVESPMSGVEVNKVDNSQIDNFTLEKIIPEVLRKCQDSYKTKKLLSECDRRLLASSIVDYFESRKIKLKLNVMDYLAEQISKHFPTEGKKAWCNRENSGGRGRLYLRLHNSHRSSEFRHLSKKRKLMAQQAETSTSAALEKVANTPLNEIDAVVHDEDGKRVQEWLKSHKCENFSEIVDMWEDTIKYRCLQTEYLNDFERVREFLDNWPSFKMDRGHELLNMDFEYLYPNAMETFRTRWMVYKQKIEALLEADLKDNNCLELLAKYQLQKARINEDSSSCVLIYMIHAITKPFRLFKTAHGNVRYTISDSQHSMTRLIQHKSEMDEYRDPYPCIFVLGDSLLEVQECYVAFMDIRYKLSYEDCLVVCIQIFTVFKLEEPQPSQYFWKFIRGYLFNITRGKEKVYAVMENMVSYLETAACT